jgi:hypothetical protein
MRSRKGTRRGWMIKNSYNPCQKGIFIHIMQHVFFQVLGDNKPSIVVQCNIC